ncbi:hypothetical protein GC174_17630 [bacterium]|nr:hypothetical protein [bacterium]
MSNELDFETGRGALDGEPPFSLAAPELYSSDSGKVFSEQKAGWDCSSLPDFEIDYGEEKGADFADDTPDVQSSLDRTTRDFNRLDIEGEPSLGQEALTNSMALLKDADGGQNEYTMAKDAVLSSYDEARASHDSYSENSFNLNEQRVPPGDLKAYGEDPGAFDKSMHIAGLSMEGAWQEFKDNPVKTAAIAVGGAATGAFIAATAPAWATAGLVAAGVSYTAYEVYDKGSKVAGAVSEIWNGNRNSDEYRQAEKTIKGELGTAVFDGATGLIPGGAAARLMRKAGGVARGEAEVSLGRSADEVAGKVSGLKSDIGIHIWDPPFIQRQKLLSHLEQEPWRIKAVKGANGVRIVDGNTRYYYAREMLGISDEQIPVQGSDGIVTSLQQYKKD